MRKFATMAFSFSLGIFAAVLIPWKGWYLWAAAIFALCGVLTAVFYNRLKYAKRMLLIFCSLTLALTYFEAYNILICRPITELCGGERSFSAVVAEYPTPTDWGSKVTVWLRPGAKAVYYADSSGLDLRPGQKISGQARWQDASRIRETDITMFTARGVRVLLYSKGEMAVEPGSESSVLFLPQRSAHAVKEMIGRIWDDPEAEAFLLAELTGDRSHISDEDSAAMSETGLAHLFAVSGLHCAFLVSLIGLLIPPFRRRLYGGVSVVVLLFYMVMVGMSPSVVRACVMQIAVLLAPLMKRDSDTLTSLSAALLVLLFLNPYAAGGVSLQLSFAATLGLVLVCGRIHDYLTGLYHGNRNKLKYVISLLSANLSASLSVLLFTVPLTAYYFHSFTLISPISNLLAVPVAGWNFMVGLITVILGFVWLPAAQLIGWINWGMVRYVLILAHWLMRLPGHAVYFSNRYLKYWLTYVYLMIGVCCLTRGNRRRFVLAGLLAVVTLFLSIGLNSREYHYGAMNAMVIDVGQGECVLLYSGDEAVLVDCGSSNSYIDAGVRAADQISSMGIHRLTAVVLTHYHADHANGVAKLLSRMPVDQLWIPDIEDEYGVRDRLVNLADRYGIRVSYITAPAIMPMGAAALTAYPPVGQGDLNEQGLTVLCSAGDFDLLVTGDMAGSTEKQLIRLYPLPSVEVFIVSHHGSKYSSSKELLQEIRPETAIICVGDNSYGHPTEEAIGRLRAAGAQVYRTDRQGNILITVYGGNE